MTGEDVLTAYAAVLEAAEVAGVSEESVAVDVRELVAANGKGARLWGGRWGGCWKREGLPGYHRSVKEKSMMPRAPRLADSHGAK